LQDGQREEHRGIAPELFLVETFGEQNQDPNDPAYYERWKSKPESDVDSMLPWNDWRRSLHG